jgi:hypothetical protein
MIIKKIIVAVVASVLVLIVSFSNYQNSALALRYRETNWTDTDMGMTDLINSGWKVIDHDTSTSSTHDSNGAWVRYTETYTFMLNKENKYIFCYLTNPKPPQAKESGCRGLN